MSLINDFNNEERKYIELMCALHVITKKYLLIAEEVAENGELFLQPLKEHRDAYDHLMRCYSVNILENEMPIENRQQYELENVKKAFGHEYRAFFDTADWLTYMLRKWVRLKLQSCGNDECRKHFENYDEIKKFINDLPLKIAELRANKDVGNFGNHENNLINEIREYQDVLDKLIELKKHIVSKLGL